MDAVKLVRNLLVFILFYAAMLNTKGMRINNEEEPNTPDAPHTMYDQRQSGKYNIHVVIKDVAIIEMDQNEISDQNYNDEEYYYDEDDLTVRPFNLTITTSSTPYAKPIVQTTVSAVESQSVETTTSTTSPDTPSSTLSANTTKASHNEFNNIHHNSGNFMTLFTTHRPAVHTKSRSKIEPIYAIEEPVFQSRRNLQDFNYGDISAQAQQPRDSTIIPNSRIFNVKVHRTHRTRQITKQKERCRSQQYRDARGNCRGRRTLSGSILKRLFRMLVALPFKPDEQ